MKPSLSILDAAFKYVPSHATSVAETWRAILLSRLLIAVGPLALTVIADGAFAKYLLRGRWTELAVSADDATGVTREQVFAIVRYVMQADPRFILQIRALLSEDVTILRAAGAGRDLRRQ